MLTRAEAAAEVMDHLIDHDSHHGYTQGSGRGGNGSFETLKLSSGEVVSFENGDLDCSEGVRRCYAAVGVLPFGYWASYMWTGNEHSMLTSHGFVQIRVQDASAMKRGDVLYKDGHTELYLGYRNGVPYQGGARINEKGTITGGRPGDQTGREVARSAYNRYQWTKAYRYMGDERNGQVPGEPTNYVGMNYRAHVQSLGWLDPVHDGQVAGTTGLSLRLEAIKCTPPEGTVCDFTVHIQDTGDVSYKGVQRGVYDPIMGTTGKSLRMEGFSIRLKENITGKKLRYRAHVQNVGWQEWKSEGEYAGTRGKSLRMEALEIEFV